MKQLGTLALAFGLLACGSALYGQPVTLNFSANTGATIGFGGASHTFNFNPGTNGFQWNVTSESGGSSAIGLNGDILNGPFSYGAISSFNLGPIIYQTAAVSGPLGNLTIFDGSGNLTGSVNFMDVETFGPATGALNASVNVNLTGISYSGSNPDLLLLQAEQPAALDVSFQFVPGDTLTQLSTGTGPYTTSFSGSISVVPEPSTLALAGFGGIAALAAIRRRK
jgi:hypothetical protein